MTRRRRGREADVRSRADPAQADLRAKLLELHGAFDQRCAADGTKSTLRKNWQNLFELMDDDKSGRLDMEEFRGAVQALGVAVEERLLKQFWTFVDEDDSGEMPRGNRPPGGPASNFAKMSLRCSGTRPLHAAHQKNRTLKFGSRPGEVTIDEFQRATYLLVLAGWDDYKTPQLRALVTRLNWAVETRHERKSFYQTNTGPRGRAAMASFGLGFARRFKRAALAFRCCNNQPKRSSSRVGLGSNAPQAIPARSGSTGSRSL